MAAIGAISAAVAAGIVSWFSLSNAKELKVSEFRQQWIDALRASIAEYLSALSYLSILYRHNAGRVEGSKDSFDMALTVQETYAQVHKSYNDIIFRINPTETDPTGKKVNADFLDALKITRQLHNSNDFERVVDACDAVREAARPLLKQEWKRVKRGEPSYNWAKRGAFVVLCAAVVVAYLLYQQVRWPAETLRTDAPKASIESPNSPAQLPEPIVGSGG